MPITFAGSAAGRWVAEFRDAQASAVPTVATQVPSGHPAVARIFHPARDFDGRPVRWSTVARARGTVFHPGAQFAALAGIDEAGYALCEDAWEGDAPTAHGLPQPDLSHLAALLSAHTGTPDSLYLGLWNGYAFAAGITAEDGARIELTAAEQADVLELDPSGYQTYWIFRGTASDLAEPLWAQNDAVSERQAPDLAWPADRSWFLSTELYEDSTLLSGPEELIRAVVEHSGLEALRVGCEIRLDAAGDEVNPPPAGPPEAPEA
ncbi:hypothetical protein [Zhihengliuella sp.]|uniref:hypothetical protein n=1 Tax=Zhihengliuella sp. TaxID=1954483 RepID=UPI002810CF55|nr:hypothetical protein [Zhihengliuella sp.]